MDNVDLSVMKRIAEWRSNGHRVVMGTIVRTWGSAPRPIGSVVAIRGDGQVAGSVSGGCIEDDLVGKVRHGSLGLNAPERMKYGISAEEANRFGLPCGGTLELVLEPVHERSHIEELLAKLADGRRVRRTLDLGTGEATLASGSAIEGADVLQVDDARLVTFHGPR